MYVGHMAMGLALKEANPKLVAWPIIIGVCLIDILGGIFLLLDWDSVLPDLSAIPYMYFDLTFMDWDHSLMMALIWTVVWGGLCFMIDKKLGWVAGFAVFSHWLMDWPVHSPDLALYPYAEYHFGGSIWMKWGTWAWIAEGILSLGLLWFAWIRSVRRGVSFFGPAAVLLGMFIMTAPSLSPMKFAAEQTHYQTYLGIILMVAFLFPAWLVLRHYRNQAKAGTV